MPYNFNGSVTVVRATTVYLRSRERRTHATQQLFYIRQDSSTCGKHAKSLLGNPMWQRNRSHRRLSSYVARTRSYNLLRSLNQGMKRHSKCNRRMIEGKFARIILFNQCGRFIKKIFNYSKVLNLSNSWLKSWKLSALWPRTSAEEKVR